MFLLRLILCWEHLFSLKGSDEFVDETITEQFTLFFLYSV